MNEPELSAEEVARVRPIHVGLFFATLATTLVAGMEMAGAGLLAGAEIDLSPSVWLEGAFYSIPVMVILFAHEMGHYLQARRHQVAATPPFFIPGVPIPGVGMLPLFGTFGAFIGMSPERIRAKQMLEIGAWGPLAGWVIAVPVLMIGIAISPIEPVPEGALPMGNTVIIVLSEWLFHPNIPEGHDVMLHPLGMAGWFGCLLTALNLLPLSQLDGGHIAYVSYGKEWNRIVPYVFGGLIVLGIFESMLWFIFSLLVYKLGIRHPDTVSDGPVRGRDSWLTWASVVMFVTTFTPAPIQGTSLLEQVTLMMELW